MWQTVSVKVVDEDEEREAKQSQIDVVLKEVKEAKVRYFHMKLLT